MTNTPDGGGANPPASSARTLGTSLLDMHMSIVRAYHAQCTVLHSYGNDLNLGPGQPKLLSYLAVHGTATQRELASYFDIDPAAVSRMLDALVRNGYAARAASESDRRAKVLSLTERGRALVASWDERCERLARRELAGFSAEERSTLMALLERVRANLVEGPREPGVAGPVADAGASPAEGEARHA